MKKKSEDKEDCGIYASSPVHIETRVALLEQSITHINGSLKDINQSLKEIKKDMKYDFRFMVGVICAFAGVMAHGFHWF